MKSGLIYIYCFIFFCFSIASTQHALDKDTLTSKKKLDYQLNTSLNQYDFDNALKVTERMKHYAIQNNDSLFLAYTYEAKNEISRFKQNIAKAKSYTKKSIQIFKKYDHHSKLLELNTSYATMLAEEGKLDSAFYTLNKIQKYITDTLPKESLQYYYNAREVSHLRSGRIDSSIHYTFKRIALIEKSDNYLLGHTYYQLAIAFLKVKDHKKALVYVDTSIEHFMKVLDQYSTPTSKAYIIKSKILMGLEKYQEAEFYINEAKNLIKDKGFTELEMQIQILLTKLFWKTGQSEKSPKIIIEQVENKKIANSTLFDFYLTQLEQALFTKNKKEARALINKLESLVDHISDLNLKQSFYQLSSTYWAETKNFKKSYGAQNLYLEIKEKTNTRQQTYMAYDLDQRYQLAKKNEEIVQKGFKIKEQENQLLKKEKHQTYLTLSIVSAILAFISLLFIYRQRQKIKNNEILGLQKQQEIIRLEALIKGEEKERNRLGQDLHDGINGDLSVIKYKITSIESSKLSEREKRIHYEAIDILDNTVEQVRLISHNLAPSSLQNFDLIQAIQFLCDKINTTNTVNIGFQYFGNQLILEKEKEISIYRIIQELVNNIAKHADATEALVQINKHTNRLHLTVEDNGKGFDLNAKNKGIGLQNIKSRVSFLRGDLDIHSGQKGTSFSIDIDLDKINNI